MASEMIKTKKKIFFKNPTKHTHTHKKQITYNTKSKKMDCFEIK